MLNAGQICLLYIYFCVYFVELETSELILNTTNTSVKAKVCIQSLFFKTN